MLKVLYNENMKTLKQIVLAAMFVVGMNPAALVLARANANPNLADVIREDVESTHTHPELGERVKFNR